MDNDGLASPGEIIRHQDIFFTKLCPENANVSISSHPSNTKYRPNRQTYKGAEGEAAVVDRVALCSDKRNNLCVKFMIRHTRRPEVGDNLVVGMGRKVFVGPLSNKKIFLSLNEAYAQI